MLNYFRSLPYLVEALSSRLHSVNIKNINMAVYFDWPPERNSFSGPTFRSLFQNTIHVQQ